MGPPRGAKRKASDRSYSGDDFQRPSPHRPGNLGLAHHNSPNRGGRDYGDSRGRGGRRPSRGRRPSMSSPVSANGPVDMPPPPQAAPPQEAPEPIHTNGDHRMSSETLQDERIPEAETLPFNYEYLTDDIVEDWEATGQKEIVKIGTQATEQDDDSILGTLMQELVQSSLSGRLAPSDAGQVINQIAATAGDSITCDDQNVHPSAPLAAFLDVICICAESKSDISARRLSELIIATEISTELLRQELDATLLEKLGLIRDTFFRMGIRKQTNILYRQANFNLMREESEGFAKLMTELFTTCENAPPYAEIVGETLEKVKAMIGAFDLDVGRSLDIVLDVFGSVLVKDFRFFVKFLRASPWWPRDSKAGADSEGSNIFDGLPQWALPSSKGWNLTDDQRKLVAYQTSVRDEGFWGRMRKVGLQAYYELGRKPATEEEKQDASRGDDGHSFSQAWIHETGTLPPNGNRDAAQLLGFKLRFYSSSAARDQDDILPDNLIYLSALLIKIGFISLSDLYPHIWRPDEEMEELRKQKILEKADRERASRPGAGARNALLMAGALADDTLPGPNRVRETATLAGTPSKDSEPDKPSTSKHSQEAADQKVLLMKSLFAIGALPEALFILGRFPWLMELYPELPEYIHRIIHHSLSSIYASVQPLSDRDSLRDQKPNSETDLPGIPKGQVRLDEAPERKVLRWALLDKDDSNDGRDYRFYWDEWNDNIPVCQTIDDMFLMCDTILELVGVKIGQDPALLLKFARIGKHSISTDKSESNKMRWLNLSKRFLLPALSLTKSNAAVVNEVFELISHFPINTRYLMYLEWYSGRTSRNPDMKAAFDQAKAETKDVLRRISRTNTRPMARALAKIAYANPHIVITTALAQIEVYDSIADVFVEGARYFTDLGYDVLTWAMISSMARDGRSRTAESGLFTSKWLAALSSFAGKLFKRYHIMRPGPILQYVEDQLSRGESGDLAMLEQIISSMAGISSDANYNDSQLQAMGGGELLQSQTLMQLLDRRHDSKSTSRRLVRSLKENDLTAKFLVSLALQRQICVFESEYNGAPLKFVGNKFDEIHQIMIQYLELLRANLTPEEFGAIIPDVSQLLVDFHISPEIAFSISRPTIAKRMKEVESEAVEKKKAGNDPADMSKDLTSIDVEMTDEMNVSAEEDGEEVEIEIITEAAATPTPAEISGSALETESQDKQEIEAPVGEAFEVRWHPVLEELMTAIGPALPPEALATVGPGFYVTFWQLSLYDILIPGKSYEDEVARQNKKIAAINADRADISIAGMRKKEAEKKQISGLIDRLLSENKGHLKSFAESKARLSQEKDQWFAGKNRIIEQLNSALIEHCFLPRLLSSPLDSYFCFKFVKFLHSAGTPNFRTLGFYDLIFRHDRLTSLIFMCTSKEADNLGRFLNEILRDLGRWHKDKATYEKEAFGAKRTLLGFALKAPGGRPAAFLDYESFRRILFKWHTNLSKAMESCFTSTEYMHNRNAISVLRSIYLHFPAINFQGIALVKLVEDLKNSGKKDLLIASRSLTSALRTQEKSWMIPQAFRKGQDKITENASSKLGVVKPEDASIPSRSSDVAKTNAEDGELADTAMTDAAIEANHVPERAEHPDQSQEVTDSEAMKVETKPALIVQKVEVSNDKATAVPSAPRLNGETSSRTQSPRAPPSRPADSRSHDLPKRVSPPPVDRPASRAHADLPSRPESSVNRNLPRDGPRMPSRPQYDLDSRYPSDNRMPQPPARHSRPLDRMPEAHDHSQDQGRSYERVLGRPPPARDDHATRNPRYAPDDRFSRSQPPREPGAPSHPPERPVRSRPEPELRGDRPDTTVRSTPVPVKPATPAEPVAGGVNPERAALIGQALDSRPNMSIRGQAQERGSHASRPPSPTRIEERKYPPRHDREDDRQPRARDPHPRSSGGHSSSRSDRPGPPTPAFEPRHSYQSRPVDMQHGRLEQDFPQRPGSSDGRSNVDTEPPSGPRARGPMPGPRSRGPPPPPVNTEVATTPTERPTPTGPRPHTRNNSYAEQPPPASPAANSAGVHPDRLAAIFPSPVESRSNVQPRAPAPIPVQTSPPSGPRSGQVDTRGGNAPVNAPSGPSPTTRGPPLGPQNPNEVAVRNRNNRHPLTAVNNTLAQAGQGASIRGRGGRQGSGPISLHVGPQVNGQGPRSEAFIPPPPLADARGDLFAQPNGASQRPDRDQVRRQDDTTDSRRSARNPSGRTSSPRDARPERSERDGHRAERDERHQSRGDEPRRSTRREEDGAEERRGYSSTRNEHERRGPPREPREAEMPPRKHGREGEGPPHGNGVGGGGRGGTRNPSESKRRRGGA